MEILNGLLTKFCIEDVSDDTRIKVVMTESVVTLHINKCTCSYRHRHMGPMLSWAGGELNFYGGL